MMKTYKYYLFILIFFLLSGCSVQSKLSRQYKGKTEAYLIQQFGKPVSVVKLQQNKKEDIFEKRTHLRKAPINTGQFQYDPFESPSTDKVETYVFTINASGIVESVQYDYRYER
jgi:hypothetical protein